MRGVPPTLARCELTFREREPIDLERAVAQHAAYAALLRSLGLEVVELPADPALPDCCFVEDVAVVLDEVALVTRPGAPSRRGEIAGHRGGARPLPSDRDDTAAGDARGRRRAARRPHALRRALGPHQRGGHRAARGRGRAARLPRGASGRDRLPAPQERGHGARRASACWSTARGSTRPRSGAWSSSTSRPRSPARPTCCASRAW